MAEALTILTIGLLAFCGVGLWWHTRCQKRWQEQLTSASAELAQSEQRQQSAMDEVQAAHRRALEHEQDLYRQIRTRLQLSPGERCSRAQILAACRRSKIDAVVLSNLLFQSPDAVDDKVFHAQIDHLVATARGLLIVESKYWKYAVFDGVDIRAQSDTLRILFGDLLGDGTRQQAVHLYRKDNEVKLRTSNPAGQVRLQAQRLSAFLTRQGATPPWINSCVYYCHPDSKVSHTDVNNGTAIVSTDQALERTIKTAQTASSARVDVDAIVKILAPLSTDTTGTGIYSRSWPSILDEHSRELAAANPSTESAGPGPHTRVQGVPAGP